MKLVDIRKVHFNDDRLPVDKKIVESLMESIPRIGLLNPIIITFIGNTPHLIAGRNRLEAYRKLHDDKIKGYGNIPVNILEYPKGSKLDWQELKELAEIEENLLRRDLTSEQRQYFRGRRVEIIKSITPDPKGGGDQKSPRPRTAKVEEGAAKKVAKETGTSSRTIRKAAQFTSAFGENLLKLAGTSLGTEKAKAAYFKASPEEQEQLLKKALKEHEDGVQPKQTKKASDNTKSQGSTRSTSKADLEKRSESAIRFYMEEAKERASVVIQHLNEEKFPLSKKGIENLEKLAAATIKKWQDVLSKLKSKGE